MSHRWENKRVCPKCNKGDALWQEVEVIGWRDVDEYGDPRPNGNHDIDDDWNSPHIGTGAVGCAHCEWEGSERNLVQLGIDGAPLPFIHPGQETLA